MRVGGNGGGGEGGREGGREWTSLIVRRVGRWVNGGKKGGREGGGEKRDERSRTSVLTDRNFPCVQGLNCGERELLVSLPSAPADVHRPLAIRLRRGGGRGREGGRGEKESP